MTVEEFRFTGERALPEMVKPVNLIKIWRGETHMTPWGSINVWQEHQSRYEFARRFCEGKVVADIACGVAYGSEYLGALKYFGFDLDVNALNWGQSRYNGCARYLAQANAVRVPVADREFGAVVRFETLEHIPLHMLGDFLMELKRVTRPEGKIILSTPNRSVHRPESIL